MVVLVTVELYSLGAVFLFEMQPRKDDFNNTSSHNQFKSYIQLFEIA